MPGATPDSWLNEQYAAPADRRRAARGVLSRIGASLQDFRGSYPSGPWGEHRSTVHFTGDTAPTWETLALAARLTPDEAAIGQPWVSHDIGSFLGRHLPDDLYARWVQLGTFQPVLRLHSHHGDRLPWQYRQAAGPRPTSCGCARRSCPYTYSAAWEATPDRAAECRPLYLDDPESAEAYAHPDEYRFGHDLLVAPVVTAGSTASREVWFPPGRWVGWFDGRTYTGPSTQTVTSTLRQMPVFVRAGGIVTQVPGAQRVEPSPAAVTLTVASSAPGTATSSMLHTDAGDGARLRDRGSRPTRPSPTPHAAGPGGGPDLEPPDGGRRERDVPGGGRGSALRRRPPRALPPDRVRVDGATLAEAAPGSTGPGWWYDDGEPDAARADGRAGDGRRPTPSSSAAARSATSVDAVISAVKYPSTTPSSS